MTAKPLLDAEGRLRLSDAPPVLTLLAAGDLCPTNRLEALLAAGDVRAAFGGCLDLFARADLTVVNLEAPLCPAASPIPKCGPNFRADPAVAGALKAAGVDVCCLANNHILDQGPAGLEATLAVLDRAGLRHLGAGRTAQAAAAPLVLEAGGLKLELLNLAEAEFARSTGGAGAAGLDPAANCRAVAESAARADAVIACLHGGCEQVLFPSPAMQRRCRELVDAGAAAVVCHHPHVPQGLEIHRGRPIAYSLGNFLFDWPEPEPETDSAFLLELGFHKAGVAELAVHPFRKGRSGGAEALAGAERAAYVRFLNGLSAPLGDASRMAALWDGQCRALWETRYRARLGRVAELESADAEARQAARLSVYNLFQCEAHGEALARALELLAVGPPACDRPARKRLAALMAQLRAFATEGSGLR